MAGIFDRFPQWRRYWGLVQEAAQRWGLNPNETLAVHIFENGAADADIRGPIAKGAQAVGLAQIWDKTISSRTNPKGWSRFAKRWNLRDGGIIPNSLKENPEFATDYLAWRMAGTRKRGQSVDEWYRTRYNPGFSGDSRGPGPSIYVTDNARTRSDQGGGIPFPVANHDTSNVSSVWGDPRDGGARLHKGVDIAAPQGTPLIAVADGTVRLERGGAGGNAVFINNTYYYAHLSKFNVQNGQKVKKGDVIGYVGSTGTSSSGPHLHFAIFKNGKEINPMKFLERAEAGYGGVDFDVSDSDDPFGPTPDAFDVFFPEPGVVPLPAGGPVASLPGLPGIDETPGLDFQRRDLTQTWQLISNQDDVDPETLRMAGQLEDEIA